MDIELAYVWIGENETGFIKNQGFNFLPNYRFEMEYHEGKEFRLNCTQIDDYPNIWKTDKIVGLTAVVGENGTGKTSLMRHLMGLGRAYRWVRIYAIDGFLSVYHNLENLQLVHPDQFPITNHPLNLELITGEQTNVYITNATNPLETSLDEEGDKLFRFIFSPDNKNALSRLFTKKLEENIPAYPEQCVYDGSPQTFAYSHPRKVGNIDIEKLIYLFYYGHASGKNTGLGSIPSNSVISFSFHENLDKKARKLLSKQAYESFLLMRRFAGRHFCDPCEDAFWALYIELIAVQRQIHFSTDDPFSYLHNVFETHSIKVDLEPSIWKYYSDAFHEIKDLCRLLDYYESNIREHSGSGRIVTMRFNKKQHRETFIRFCKYISHLIQKECSFVLKYINIDISPVSSGENALRNIFACLALINSIEKIFKVRSDVKLGKNILLLLDEIDLYLHPEWQRKFLMQLATRLEKEHPDRKIQLVITTHSPLVLSDIPSGNIIYLDNQNNQCVVTARPEANETFGANIHTLLKDSFYLERSLGDFAYAKIREVIDDLQGLKNWGKEDPTEKQRKLEEKCTREAHQEKCRAHKQMIDIIGEPIIKGKLQRLYAELFSDDLDIRIESRLTDFRHILKTMSDAERERYMAELEHVMTTMKKRRDEV